MSFEVMMGEEFDVLAGHMFQPVVWLHASSRELSAAGVTEKYKKLWVSYMCNKC